jgi:hypothetical protein
LSALRPAISSTFSISDPVIVDRTPGFLPPRFDEKLLSLRPSELRSALGRTLLILQSCGSLSGGPKVDYFRHLNDQWYPDACAWVGTDPLIKVNYADTVTLDHVEWPRAPASPSKFP